jgi:hypothetical protein
MGLGQDRKHPDGFWALFQFDAVNGDNVYQELFLLFCSGTHNLWTYQSLYSAFKYYYVKIKNFENIPEEFL